MKTALSSFDLRALVAEWQDLVGGHVDKAYQRGDEVILRINAPVRGKAELFYQAGRWLCVHEVETKPETPPPFAQTLRRLLDNARVLGIEQRGFDRIAVFHLERSGESSDLVFEVFGKGNLVVVKGATIAAVLFPQTFKDRSVQLGEPYQFPEAGLDPLELDRGGFANALRGAKGQVVRVLASVLNLGGTYAEEICLRAHVDKTTKVKDLAEAQVDGLYTALNNVAVAGDQERRPGVVFQDGRAIDATPIELLQYRDLERREFPTLNEALSHYLTVAEPEMATVEDVPAKFERRIAQQRESLDALREDAVRLEAQAVFLYGHYAVFDDLVRRPPDPRRAGCAHERPACEETSEGRRPLRPRGRSRSAVHRDQRRRQGQRGHASGGVRVRARLQQGMVLGALERERVLGPPGAGFKAGGIR